ncbi:MAG: hypothetical protein GY863_01550, partial [bacterium]|nr:hypothetical protein [bacterium]
MRLYQGHWLMYFLHWRPLTKEIENINPAYVRHQLLNFWGPNMAYFKLNGQEGDLVVNGHRAYYVNGTYLDMVKTRFIIWNCPETGRQFTADLNINIKMNTPDVLHEIQQLITSTISCHGEPHSSGSLVLPKLYNSYDLGVSFYIPENWKTSKFEASEWFPEGQNRKNGTLWTLLTDSEKYVELLWKETGEKISEEMVDGFIETVQNYKPVRNDSSRIFDVKIESSTMKNSEILYSGTMKYGTHQKKFTEYSDDYIFKGRLWKDNGKVYFLIAAMIDQNNVWNRTIDITPSEARIERFIVQEILPFIKMDRN